jgi:hypothetical protein
LSSFVYGDVWKNTDSLLFGKNNRHMPIIPIHLPLVKIFSWPNRGQEKVYHD